MPTVKLAVSSSCCIEFDSIALAAFGVEIHPLEDATLGNFDVALLDGRDGAVCLALMHDIRESVPSCKFVIQLLKETHIAIAFLQAGATGLLSSLPDVDYLAKVIINVAHGQYHLDQPIAQLLAMRQIKRLLAPFTSLSSREFDVFCLLAEDLPLNDIATQLGISSKTVSNCQSQIKLKLGLAHRIAIKHFANKHGLMLDKDV